MLKELGERDVIVALGSNLDQPKQQILRALEALGALQHSDVVAVSSLYGSEPVGPEQPDYVNAVAHLRTSLGPHTLLDALQAIERAHQRVRGVHWGARTLDLDIALFGQRTLKDERLTVPHAYLAERPFVLLPLAELYPELHLFSLGVSVSEQLSQLPSGTVWRLPETDR